VNKVPAQADFDVGRRELAAALRKLRNGDFTVSLPEDGPPENQEIALLFNEVVGINRRMAEEFQRLSRVVGKEGKIGHRASVRGAVGDWELTLSAINELIDDMVQPTTEVARVIGAVAKGDLSQTMAVEIEGRALRKVLASEIMTTQPLTARETMTLEEVANLFQDRYVTRLPVVRDKKLVGIVARSLRYMASGSSILSPIGNAVVGVAGETSTSAWLNAAAKSREISVRTFCACP